MTLPNRHQPFPSISRLYLSPTHDCNCSCEYCYVPARLRRAPVADDGFFVKVLDEFLLARGDELF